MARWSYIQHEQPYLVEKELLRAKSFIFRTNLSFCEGIKDIIALDILAEGQICPKNKKLGSQQLFLDLISLIMLNIRPSSRAKNICENYLDLNRFLN